MFEWYRQNLTVRFQFGCLFFRAYLQKNYFNHNEVPLALHPFTYYFLEQGLQIHIHKKLTKLKDGYGNISVMTSIIIKYYIFLTKTITPISMSTFLCKPKSYGLQRRHQTPLPNQLTKNYFTDPRFWFFEWLSLYLAYIK